MNKLSAQEPTLGKIRLFFWPIHKHELKKFFPLACIMLCLLFNYTILRNTKDALVATSIEGGPEIIPYLKSLFVMPSIILFSYFYAHYAPLFSFEKVFYAIVSSLLFYFIIFCFLLYPFSAYILPSHQTILLWKTEYPHFKFLFSIIGIWTYSLFYIFSELWGSITLVLLFWQFSSSVIPTEQAKRFYPLYALIANLALILSGTVVTVFSDIRTVVPAGEDPWGLTLKYLGISLILSGIIAMFIFRRLHKQSKFFFGCDKIVTAPTKKIITNESFLNLFKSIMSSSYLRLLAMIVLGYGMSINLVEIIWKKQLALHFIEDQNGYNAFMGRFSQVTGLSTIALCFLTKGVIRRFGWFVGALACPIVLAATGLIFISFILFNNASSPIILGLGYSATFVAAIMGAAQNILSKGTKYALFDPTKEMAYIPLSQELRVKGKSVVDITGGLIGKASGAYTIIFLLSVTGGDILTITPYLVIFLVIILFSWMVGVSRLNRAYKTQIILNESCKEPSNDQENLKLVA